MQEISFNKILIGFAFSPNLKANVFEAIRLADFFDAHLYFLHVGSKSVSKEQTLNNLLEEAPIKLKQVSVIWQEGKPVETIVDQCKKMRLIYYYLVLCNAKTWLSFTWVLLLEN